MLDERSTNARGGLAGAPALRARPPRGSRARTRPLDEGGQPARRSDPTRTRDGSERRRGARARHPGLVGGCPGPRRRLQGARRRGARDRRAARNGLAARSRRPRAGSARAGNRTAAGCDRSPREGRAPAARAGLVRRRRQSARIPDLIEAYVLDGRHGRVRAADGSRPTRSVPVARRRSPRPHAAAGCSSAATRPSDGSRRSGAH